VRFVGADSETVPFSPRTMAPPLVCFQWQELGSDERHIQTRRGGALGTIQRFLEDPDVTLVFHNGPYDAAVFCAEGLTRQVFRAYQEGRILCTYLYERLGEIAGLTGRKSGKLGFVCEAHGIPAPSLKNDGLATDFAQFLDAAEIPEPHRSYALDDCIVIKVFERQLKRFGAQVPMRALQRLAYRQFCLQLSSVWGMPVNSDAVAALEAMTQQELDVLVPAAVEAGLLEWRSCTRQGLPAMGWVKNEKRLRELVFDAYDGHPPMTTQTTQARRKYEKALAAYQRGERKRRPKEWVPRVSIAAETLRESGDPDLMTFALYGTWAAVQNKDLPMLHSGGGRLHPKYDITDTCRTLTAKPAVQNWLTGLNTPKDRTGAARKVPQIRECVEAPPGYAIYAVDMAGLELASFAQNVCNQLGLRRMVNDLNTGVDLHSRIGARMMGLTYEAFRARFKAGDPECYWWRQAGKGNNFGRQGGMANPEKFARYCKTQYKCPLTVDQARESGRVWAEESPDGVAWLEHIKASVNADGTFDALLPGFGIVRRGVWYCAAANNPFQELAAFMCSECTIALTEEFYLGSLGDCRMITHIHDEWLVLVPEPLVAEADRRIRAILTDVARRVFPDVRSCVPEAKAMRRWSKRAKEVRAPDGTLRVWSDAAA
jgi:hypothetical protein